MRFVFWILRPSTALLSLSAQTSTARGIFLPAKPSGHGSIEFRRAPGVADTAHSKHWSAFVMAFVETTLQHSAADVVKFFLDPPLGA